MELCLRGEGETGECTRAKGGVETCHWSAAYFLIASQDHTASRRGQREGKKAILSKQIREGIIQRAAARVKGKVIITYRDRVYKDRLKGGPVLLSKTRQAQAENSRKIGPSF